MGWFDIPDYEGFYQINEEGQVKSVERTISVYKNDGTVMERVIRSRIMKLRQTNGDSLMVGLSIDGNVSIVYVYELMRIVFQPHKLFLKFKDKDNTNLNIENLLFVDEHTCDFFCEGKLKETDLTQELLEECFTYAGGQLYWKDRPTNHFKTLSNYRAFVSESEGKVAGYYNKRTDSGREDFGYRRLTLSLGGSRGDFKLHRLIFLLLKGYLPKIIDHLDGNQENNNIENLRESNCKKNSYNLRKPINNTSGYKGVSQSNDPKRVNSPYKAAISWEGYTFGLGNYSDLEEAATAYNIAARLFFKEFAALNDTQYEESSFPWKGKFFTKDYYKIEEGTFDWSTKTKKINKRKV